MAKKNSKKRSALPNSNLAQTALNKAVVKGLNTEYNTAKKERTWSKRVYIKSVAECITKYQKGVSMLQAINVIIKTVRDGVVKYPELFDGDIEIYTDACDELNGLVTTSTDRLTEVLNKYFGAPADNATPEEIENTPSLIPAFTPTGRMEVADWLFNVTHNIYESLYWVDSATQLLEMITTAADALDVKNKEVK